MSSLCWECKYEHSDCKGNKWIEKTKCDYFSKKCAINYPQKIRELEELLEQADRRYDILLKENERLLIRADRFEAGNKDLKAKLKQTDEAYYSQGEQLLEALDEIEKLKAKIEERVECGADCSTCEVKCRAWQNGYNATCERECDNCEVITDMQSLKNVLSKLMFDYADDLRGDAE